ncbi:hypothetical protein COY13_04110 [Candidatus Roizmanbacteria bacterium CG_4_10_14_0_2_um_filter_36_35]|uniref:Uncharacterized protein n=4 Tax=Candidatus Roizmaniibacteriota TaxID=1752723 RepID=A0A2M7BVU3_9BACT|nr:MAG: hypothetical protein COV86_01745 [Candidatus Roizmanbacteria bacterium CG11_big_fil_rev_8_21_14_0_20_35_14]PIV10645.1 MAG: hypothetical protein COS50_04310 [Candidatus Roizmanbacteria bacterium CG03_land_8_20_14_0_80_35_26]PIZ67100.1 MAG: hypothetical protein COY13_04110 [Candidatus Roizmanbacteria bacterium CG_4_10_14_0_2_um_filter_36_35]PJC32716.1 MAG: hypothetical protein CO049_02170 [Candidatus Roizmanbacteria bacterium CG_4_9_14_0_2_um_filter_36_12]PJC81056.1 MAG: hypothetical prot
MKKAPYVFLLLLTVVLVFLIGFRSGQKTEKINKTIDYLLSITPSPSYSPTPSVSYKEYKSRKWGLKFTFPSNLKLKESTNTAEILFEMKK